MHLPLHKKIVNTETVRKVTPFTRSRLARNTSLMGHIMNALYNEQSPPQNVSWAPGRISRSDLMKVHASQHDLYENWYSKLLDSNKIKVQDRMGRLWLNRYPPSIFTLCKVWVEIGHVIEYLASLLIVQWLRQLLQQSAMLRIWIQLCLLYSPSICEILSQSNGATCHAFPQLQSSNVPCEFLVEIKFVCQETRRKFKHEKKDKVTLATTILFFRISVGQ